MFKSPINRPIIDIKKILAIAKAAGKIHMHYYNKDNIAVSYKEDDSPVTMADTDSNILICNELNKIYPDIPIISEENENENINHDIFWCVDPLDGTRGFLKKNGEFTVNIALIYNKRPILGVIYASLSQDIYYVGNDNIPYKEPFGRIESRKVPKEGLTVITSSFFASDDKIKKHLKDKKVDKLIKASSSLKLCLIAEGKADLYPRFGRTMEWDTAAGHAILSAAGGSIKDFEGNDLSYGNLDKKYYNPSFIAQGLITRKGI